MRFITPPLIKDEDVLDALSKNLNNPVRERIVEDLIVLKKSLNDYVIKKGNALEVSQTKLAHPEELKKLYSRITPTGVPADLKHILQMRIESSDECCSMCGSFHSGTLDHVFPKATYPEFSIFSRNLVPACRCNSLKNDVLIGPDSSRVLHPYYDEIFNERLISMKFEDLSRVPIIDIELLIENTHPLKSSLDFHCTHLVKRVGLLKYLNKTWARLLRKHVTYLPFLKYNPVNEENLKIAINDSLAQADDEFSSKNNWKSVFLSGLDKPHIIQWLSVELNSLNKLI